MIKKRKGQFYIVAAIIIVVVLSGIFLARNYIITEKEPREFYDLTEELDLESGKVIDYGIYKGGDIPDLLDSFTDEYLNYSKNKIDAGDWIFVYGNSTDLEAVGYSTVTSGTIGIVMGEGDFEVKVTRREKWKRRSIKPLKEKNGKEKFKIKAFNTEYEFELEKGQNFYFLIGSGGEYVERN